MKRFDTALNAAVFQRHSLHRVRARRIRKTEHGGYMSRMRMSVLSAAMLVGLATPAGAQTPVSQAMVSRPANKRH